MTPSAQLSRHQLLGATFSFQHLPMAEVAAILSRHGFREMELWGIAPHLDLFHTDDAKVAALRGLLADHGLTVRIFTPEQVVYPVNIASGDGTLSFEPFGDGSYALAPEQALIRNLAGIGPHLKGGTA